MEQSIVGSGAAAEGDRSTGAFPVTCSVLSEAALAEEVARRYDLGRVERCWLLVRNQTDTYEVRAGGRRYALRVCHHGTRSLADVAYEIDLIRHAAAAGVRAAAPVAQRDGRHPWVVPAPEGERVAVLFDWVEGQEWPRPHPSEAYGRAVASMHEALDDFAPTQPRARLDAERLLTGSLATMEPYLSGLPDVAAYLRALVAALRARIEATADGLEWGACHGDLHGGNAVVGPDGAITFIDFDDCGPGWRAFELAVFRWGSRNPGTTRDWDAYLRGYTAVRPIGQPDLAAVPLFVAVRTIWWLGMMTSHAGRWGGRAEYGPGFWEGPLAVLVEWLAENPDCLGRDTPAWACGLPGG